MAAAELRRERYFSLASAGGFYANWERGQPAELLSFQNYSFEVSQGFFRGYGVHLPGGVVAFLDELLEVPTGNLNSKLIGNDLARAIFLLNPGHARQGDRHRTAVHVETNVDGIRMAGGDGHNVGLPLAVEVFAGPAVGHVEVFVHVSSVPFRPLQGKDAGHVQVDWLLTPLVD